jgi:hypothetical protein
MDEWDKIIRQKVSGLDTPPPGTSWQPERSWKKLPVGAAAGESFGEQTGKPPRGGGWPWYYAAAAAFVILLVPFAVMLSDLREQQAQIERMAAALARDQQKMSAIRRDLPKPSPVTVPGPVPVLRETSVAVRRPRPKSFHTRRPAPVADIHLPAALPPVTPAEALPPAVVPADEEKRMVHTKQEEKQLLRVLVARAPRKQAPTRVTILFSGNGTGTDPARVAAQTPPSPRRKSFRIFTHGRVEAGPTPASVEAVPPVLSAKIK